MNNTKLNKLMLGTLMAFLFLGLSSIQIKAQVSTIGGVITVNNAPIAELERECYNAFQGKIAFDRTGNNVWNNLTLQNFCKGTTNPIATASCFDQQIRLYNNWEQAIQTCKAVTSQSTVLLEKNCFNGIQGKIAFDKAGSTNWGANYVQQLCKGTSNPTATIICFDRQIQETNTKWQQAIGYCKNWAVAGNSLTPAEDNCLDIVQRMPYDRAGNTNWGAANIQKLCEGTSSTVSTTACFQQQIEQFDNWQQAIEICKAVTNQSTAQLQEKCYNSVQGKVAYDNAGNKNWGETNARRLCNRTTNPTATVICFTKMLKQFNDWNKAINVCTAE